MYFIIFNPASLLSHAAGPPVNCEYSAFGPWSECSRRCGGGFRSRERNIQILARRGGKPCRGGSRETQICNQQSCPRKNARNLTAFIRLSARPSVRGAQSSDLNPSTQPSAFSLRPSSVSLSIQPSGPSAATYSSSPRTLLTLSNPPAPTNAMSIHSLSTSLHQTLTYTHSRIPTLMSIFML